nr:hypothetical protein [uncultured Romboutsia sp.]
MEKIVIEIGNEKIEILDMLFKSRNYSSNEIISSENVEILKYLNTISTEILKNIYEKSYIIKNEHEQNDTSEVIRNIFSKDIKDNPYFFRLHH